MGSVISRADGQECRALRRALCVRRAQWLSEIVRNSLNYSPENKNVSE